MAKGNGHDGDSAFDNPSRIGPKRPYQWFVNAGESELFPNKKQGIQTANNKPSVEVSNSSFPFWENTSSFQTVPNQFIGRLFESESARSVNFVERNLSPVGTPDMRRKGIVDQFVEDESVGLSISHAIEDPEASCFYHGGCSEVKVNQVKDSNGGMHAPKEHNLDGENNKVNQSSYMTMALGYNKEDDSVILTGHTYNQGGSYIRSTGSTSIKGEDGVISLSDTYSKEDTNIISFVGFHNEHEIIPVVQPTNSCDSTYHQFSVEIEAAPEIQLNTYNNASAVAVSPRVAKSKPESLSKSKLEFKTSKKEAPNSFPSNVGSLISTGMLDGVPVKYVSLSQEELRGVIKGSGYLCGCQLCNYSKMSHSADSKFSCEVIDLIIGYIWLHKVLNAFEFERHACCKTKHPNNHIYFENGKTIYQIVQELRSTPERLLFDTIQTVFGAPINQKSFKIWKESFQAATRELQRIYGKEELNL